MNVESPEKVKELIKTNFSNINIQSEYVDLLDSLGRVLAEDIISPENVPQFNRSTVDGYAVKANDTFGASESLPTILNQIGEVEMGKSPTFTIEEGQCAYIPTGGQLPEGADGVIMIEYTSKLDNEIFIEKSIAPSDSIIFKGDDVNINDIIFKKGHKLRSQDLGTLAALGINKPLVNKKIKIGIISTGDELIDIDKKVEGSQIRDVNRYTISAGIKELGLEPYFYGIVKDEWELLKEALEDCLEKCDVVLISGGSSVGTKDMTTDLINACGDPGVFVRGVALKPGKPTIIGNCNGIPVFGLPGNPVAAFFIFRLFVFPLLCDLMGHDIPINYSVKATLTTNVPSTGGREEYIPVALTKDNENYLAKPIYYKSGLISALSTTNGFICVARNTEGLYENQEVSVMIF